MDIRRESKDARGWLFVMSSETWVGLLVVTGKDVAKDLSGLCGKSIYARL